MSYDLTFLARTAEQSWDEAIEAAQEVESYGPPDVRVWRAILDGARGVLGEVDVFESDDWYELTHESTGIQVSLFAAEAGMTVPYHYAGEDAKAVLLLVYRIGRVVERATGWSGYDPQVEMPIAEAATQIGLGVATFDRVVEFLADLPNTKPA